MDLTLQVGDSAKLNVRVAVILETNNGLVFSQNKKDEYLYPIGGRAKIGENSVESAVRELEEEVGLKISASDFKLISIVENFWGIFEDGVDWRIHEINFVFTVPKQEKLGVSFDVDTINLHEIKKENLKDLDIRPEIIKQLVLTDSLNTFSHHIV